MLARLEISCEHGLCKEAASNRSPTRRQAGYSQQRMRVLPPHHSDRVGGRRQGQQALHLTEQAAEQQRQRAQPATAILQLSAQHAINPAAFFCLQRKATKLGSCKVPQ